jgi:hypothetical protein
MSNARASHGTQTGLPGGGNAAAHLNRVKSEGAAGRMNAAAAYSETNLDRSAMAAGSHGDHIPVSIRLGRNWRSGTDDCSSGGQSDGAHTIANHGVLLLRI